MGLRFLLAGVNALLGAGGSLVWERARRGEQVSAEVVLRGEGMEGESGGAGHGVCRVRRGWMMTCGQAGPADGHGGAGAAESRCVE